MINQCSGVGPDQSSMEASTMLSTSGHLLEEIEQEVPSPHAPKTKVGTPKEEFGCW